MISGASRRRADRPGFLAQMQGDLGAAPALVDLARRCIRQRGVAGHRAFPLHAVPAAEAGAAGATVTLSATMKAEVEADTELADQVGVLLLVAGAACEEFLGARFWRWCPGWSPPRRGSCRCRCPTRIFSSASSSDSPPFSGLRNAACRRHPGMETKLPQEYLAVRIQQMDHEVQQLLSPRPGSSRFARTFARQS